MLLAAVALSTTSLVGHASAGPTTTLVSLPLGSPDTAGNGYAPDLSADGRFVAFHDGFVVLVRDLQTGETVLASRASGPNGMEGRQPSFAPYASAPSISADGRLVAFVSAQSLDPDASNEFSDVFVRDLVTHSTTLVSRAAGDDGPATDSFSVAPSISADGRFVAFESRASNLDHRDSERPGDFETTDVFLRDLETGTTTLVSRASGEAGVDGNNASISPAISGDGRFVVFNSLASNLHPSDRDELEDVYVRDMHTGETILVNRGITPVRGGIGVTGSPSISLDGQVVAFTLDDRVFVRNLQTATAKLVSVGADSSSMSPALSGDGRYVAFSSYASTLQPYHTAPFPDIFVRDMKRRRTILASRAANVFGTPGNGGSHDPSISADGRVVVFEARASNLHPQDRDRSGDIFVRDLGPGAFRARASASCGGRRATVIVLPRSWSHGTRKPWPFRGTAGPDVVVGSRGSDRLAAGSGPDRICGRGGRDRLDGGSGPDRITGGPGRDIIRSRDNSSDSVDCGPGRDRVVADSIDRLRRCERRDGTYQGERRAQSR